MYKCAVCKTEHESNPLYEDNGVKVCSEECKKYLLENKDTLSEDNSESVIQQTQLML